MQKTLAILLLPCALALSACGEPQKDLTVSEAQVIADFRFKALRGDVIDKQNPNPKPIVEEGEKGFRFTYVEPGFNRKADIFVDKKDGAVTSGFSTLKSMNSQN